VKRAAKATFQGFLSTQEAKVRRQRLLQIANDAEALAKHPPTATYQAFERLLNTAQGLGANIPRETIIAVGSAFVRRPSFPGTFEAVGEEPPAI
jgi:16S rRNA C1402 (ribose-2'-O) methylase RsmI